MKTATDEGTTVEVSAKIDGEVESTGKIPLAELEAI